MNDPVILHSIGVFTIFTFFKSTFIEKITAVLQRFNFTQNPREMALSIRKPLFFSIIYELFNSSTFEKNNGFSNSIM